MFWNYLLILEKNNGYYACLHNYYPHNNKNPQKYFNLDWEDESYFIPICIEFNNDGEKYFLFRSIYTKVKDKPLSQRRIKIKTAISNDKEAKKSCLEIIIHDFDSQNYKNKVIFRLDSRIWEAFN
ncbi:MAG: hypothetical protein U9Q69_00925 [Nanoarchaeota archaeon]|nr:hypothetical protein [Nanoarchaeota archaeon]